MSYFDAGVGKRPIEQVAAEQAPIGQQSEATPYFVAQLGPCTPERDRGLPQFVTPGRPDAQAHPLTHSSDHPLKECPLCRGPLEDDDGLYRCVGRCGARWFEEAPGRLLDLAALPLGVCACCHPPLVLIRSPAGAVCPTSGSAYLILAEGPRPLALAAPEGLCLCCAPPAPLARRGTVLCCSSKPEQLYQRAGSEVVLLTAENKLTPAETLDAIDTALRRNSARLTVNGLFDID